VFWVNIVGFQVISMSGDSGGQLFGDRGHFLPTPPLGGQSRVPPPFRGGLECPQVSPDSLSLILAGENHGE
jgi:hypothetical protein